MCWLITRNRIWTLALCAPPPAPQMDTFTCRNSTGSVVVLLWILHIRSEMYCCCVIITFTSVLKCLQHKSFSKAFFNSDAFIGEDSLLLEEELVLSDDIAFVYCQEMGLFRPALRNPNCVTHWFFFSFSFLSLCLKLLNPRAVVFFVEYVIRAESYCFTNNIPHI